MNPTRFTLLLFIIVLTISCNKNNIYKESFSLPDNHWEKNNIVTFSPKIQDTSITYNIVFALRHIYGFQIKDLPLVFEVVSPSGVTNTYDYTLRFYDENLKPLSDCAGDYCDLETTIAPEYTFTETGIYTFKVRYNIKAEMIPNIMLVGLMIDKTVQK